MKEFHVERPSGDIEIVYADYSKVQDGHLYLRTFRTERNTYPELVKVFAPRAWNTLSEGSLTHDTNTDDIPF